MGMFHNTLLDAERLFEGGKYKKAEEVLKKHIASEYHFSGSMQATARCIHEYQGHIIRAMGTLGSFANKANRTDIHFKDFKDEIEGARLVLQELYDELKHLVIDTDEMK